MYKPTKNASLVLQASYKTAFLRPSRWAALRMLALSCYYGTRHTFLWPLTWDSDLHKRHEYVLFGILAVVVEHNVWPRVSAS